MAVDLSGLQAAVARNTTVDDSAATMIRGIAKQIRDAIAADDIGDATNINALAAQLESSTDNLAGAVSENTPAAETPAEPAAPEGGVLP
jgi:ribosomal protein S20